jgi:hypothetical protein
MERESCVMFRPTALSDRIDRVSVGLECNSSSASARIVRGVSPPAQSGSAYLSYWIRL